MPKSIDLAIAGAGPQALTLVTHLLQKRKRLRGRFIVFDPSGDWLQRWHSQFAAAEIAHLRSPAVHHPDPNPHALRTFAEQRPQELFPPYDLPSTSLFWEFCQDVIRCWQLQNLVYPALVREIEPLTHRGRQRFCLWLSTGESILARRVVLAIAGGKAQIPAWVDQIRGPYPSHALLHSEKIDLRTINPAGEKILIVGSGLTSGHLAIGAIKRGAQVILMARRKFYSKLFDAEPGWLGPKYLKGFAAEPNWEKRWQLIQNARNGGSLTPPVLAHLRRLEKEGQLIFYEHCQITGVQWQDNHWQVSCNYAGIHDCVAHLDINRLWLCTGSTINVDQWSLLAGIRSTQPIPTVNGLPVLNHDLSWAGSNLHILGGAAALQLGPVARNLAGGRMAGDRLVSALMKT
ncbi:FAD/NAD(P)-binding protein [Synechocystis sp. CS-94]|uniref:FAD/NAD(P)-binding protein n=1 Tax=Synechocystis sp. CS-94 TaxID=2847986 RepID=UPI00223B1D3A|nr:FAD/NAD(P)-binding protein [Synechocystis sp. CS-94]